MYSPPNPKRRIAIQSCLALAIAASYGCSTQPMKPTSIAVDVFGVDTVPKLIDAIKRAGGKWLQDSIPDTEFIKAFAHTFVQNAWAAAENGFKIPQWVLDKLPARKVVFPILGVMVITLFGIEFLIPVATVITAVLGSMALMATAILAAIGALLKSAMST
ncbi:MAG: hypothetical protein RJA63_4149 [Pseudomonadota bacterium]|jgi:hypothetical protein